MAEYIEREALLEDIEEERPENWTNSEAERQAENDFFKYRDIVKIQPTADVVEVKHGEWVYDHWCEFKCSVCGHFSNTNPRGKENYCPNCGVKMDLKEGAEE